MKSNRIRRSKTLVDSARWAGYMVAAASTSICSQQGRADIHVVDIGVELMDSAPGDTQFGVPHSATFGDSRAALQFWHLSGYPTASAGVLAVYGSIGSTAPASFRMSFAGSHFGPPYFYAYRLAYGEAISTQSAFISAGNRGDMAWNQGGTNSQWINRDGYLGFQFDIGSGTQYGWAELTLLNGLPQHLYRLERIAWADPGESLYAGQIPEPGSLSLLSLGALGLLTWRRRRKQSRV
ncbi:MAG: PEP-CTERM sorting domain-containing protein [Planctomycetota bacterium]